MKDVLETLRKLPPKCAAVIGGHAVFIRRGAAEMAPAHIPTDQVDQWNVLRSVKPEQVQAMVVGVTLGWDKDGADPDSHAADLQGEAGPFDWTYVATLTVELKVSAHTEEQALAAANHLARMAVLDIEDEADPEFIAASVESIDLIETTNPNP